MERAAGKGPADGRGGAVPADVQAAALTVAAVSAQLAALEQHVDERFDRVAAQVAALEQQILVPAGAGGSSGGASVAGARGIRRPGGDVDDDSSRRRARRESPPPQPPQPPELLQQLLQPQPQGELLPLLCTAKGCQQPADVRIVWRQLKKRWCPEHKCSNVECKNAKTCVTHQPQPQRCTAKECQEPADPNIDWKLLKKRWCVEHKCANVECKNFKNCHTHKAAAAP
jgi:hypothetical protein